MSLRVISLGVGRTGTFSMKLALEELGFGPCHHMEEVDARSAQQVAFWAAAARGQVDMRVAYAGFNAAVDWPTAAFCHELYAAFPNAKFILTVRDPEKWYKSFSETIVPLIQPDEKTPPDLLPFLAMVMEMVEKTGFRIPSTKINILAAYERHIVDVTSTIPADRLLVFEVKQGWEALCEYLGVPVPAMEFPRTNNTKDFWDSVQAGG